MAKGRKATPGEEEGARTPRPGPLPGVEDLVRAYSEWRFGPPGGGGARPAARVPEEKDPGLACVRELFEAFSVDEEWSCWEERGFRWWPHRVEQRVWAEPATWEPELGLAVARVHAETGVVRKVGIPLQRARFVASAAVLDPSLNAFLAGEEISLRAAVWVHEENLGWAGSLLQLAALAQVRNAERLAEGWAEVLGGEPAFSAHPARGPRPLPDEMLGALEGLPGRGAPSAWAEGPELRATADALEAEGLAASLGPAGLSVELPGGPGSPRLHRLEVTTAPHEGLGGGVRLRLLMADWPRDPFLGVTLFPVDLNELEIDQEPPCHLIGSWAAEPDPGARPYFNCFVPNALYRPGILLNLVVSMAIRARWADALIDPPEEEEEW